MHIPLFVWWGVARRLSGLEKRTNPLKKKLFSAIYQKKPNICLHVLMKDTNNRDGGLIQRGWNERWE